jgi:tetratricopeptide (TPR) repeat protein
MLGESYTPPTDDEILERLPAGLKAGELRRQRRELAEDPANLKDSVELARSYLGSARSEGDPRFVGFAQAVLGPWWDDVSPPVPVLLLRARVRRGSWEFDRSLADLEAALSREPGLREAAVDRLEVLLSRGDVRAARAAWETLAGQEPDPLVRATLTLRIRRFGNNVLPAYTNLLREASAAIVVNAQEAGAASRLHDAWFLLADVAWQLGQRQEAENHFKAAAATGGRDVSRVAAHADFLLDRNQPDAAAAMLGAEAMPDILAVRWCEAVGRLKTRDADLASNRAAWTNRLSQRFLARRARGDASVLADELRFHLGVTQDSGRALAAARELWSVRREIDDARRVLEAAGRAGDRGCAQPVLDWIQRHELRDRRLAQRTGTSGGQP